MSAMIYCRASPDFRLAFKTVISELFHAIGRNETTSPDVALDDGTTPRESHVNKAIFWDGAGTRNFHQSQSSPQSSKSMNCPSRVEDEEPHVVPFHQTKYLGEKDKTHADFCDENDLSGGVSVDDHFGFTNDIEIVPYDESS